MTKAKPNRTVKNILGNSVSKLAFLQRFSDEEAIAIDLASIGATEQAASIRRYLNIVDAAEFIDLSRDDLKAGVLAMVDFNVLSSDRAKEILDTTTITAKERYRG